MIRQRDAAIGGPLPAAPGRAAADQANGAKRERRGGRRSIRAGSQGSNARDPAGARQHMCTRGRRRLIAHASLCSDASPSGAARHDVHRRTRRHEPEHRKPQHGGEGAAPGPRRCHLPHRAFCEQRPAFRPLQLHFVPDPHAPRVAKKKRDLRVPSVQPGREGLARSFDLLDRAPHGAVLTTQQRGTRAAELLPFYLEPSAPRSANASQTTVRLRKSSTDRL